MHSFCLNTLSSGVLRRLPSYSVSCCINLGLLILLIRQRFDAKVLGWCQMSINHAEIAIWSKHVAKALICHEAPQLLLLLTWGTKCPSHTVYKEFLTDFRDETAPDSRLVWVIVSCHFASFDVT